MALDLYLNVDASDKALAIVSSPSAAEVPKKLPSGTLGDTVDYNIRPIHRSGSATSWAGDPSYTVKVGVGPRGGVANSGTFYVQDDSQASTSGPLVSGQRYKITSFQSGDDFANVHAGSESGYTGFVFEATGTTPTTWTNSSQLTPITSDLAYNITASALQTSLNAMNDGNGLANGGNVTVTNQYAGNYKIKWDTAGTIGTVSGNSDNLDPTSTVVFTTLTEGTASVQEVKTFKLARQPVAFQETWTADAANDLWTGSLSFNTNRLNEFLDGAESLDTVFEIEITDDSGNKTTYAQVEFEVTNEVVDAESFEADPSSEKLSTSDARSQYVGNRSGITGLTGGTSTDLDGIATAGTSAFPIGGVVVVEVSTGVIVPYRLYSGADSEDSPNVIRPDDYAASTNEKVWKKLGLNNNIAESAQIAFDSNKRPIKVAANHNRVSMWGDSLTLDSELQTAWDSGTNAITEISLNRLAIGGELSNEILDRAKKVELLYPITGTDALTQNHCYDVVLDIKVPPRLRNEDYRSDWATLKDAIPTTERIDVYNQGAFVGTATQVTFVTSSFNSSAREHSFSSSNCCARDHDVVTVASSGTLDSALTEGKPYWICTDGHNYRLGEWFSEISSVDTGTETITLPSTHKFSDDDQVVIIPEEGGTKLGGTNTSDVYYVINSTSTTIQISTSSGGSAHNITSSGSGTIRVYKIAEIAGDGTGTMTISGGYHLGEFIGYQRVDLDDTTDTLTTTSDHGLSINDRVVFGPQTFLSLGNIDERKMYFVKTVPSDTTFTVSETKGGSTFDLGSSDNGLGLRKFKAGGFVMGSSTSSDYSITFEHLSEEARDIQIFWIGRNNATDPEQVKSDIQAMVDHCRTQKKDFLVLTVLNDSSETLGTSQHGDVTNLNAWIMGAYPDNALDIRELLVSQGTSGEQDSDITPSAMRDDTIHLNSTGYDYVVGQVDSWLQSKGYY
jgi:hypothetical protein